VVDRERLDPRGDVPEDLGEDVVDDRADAFLFGGSRQPFAADVLRAVNAAAPRVDLFAPDGLALAQVTTDGTSAATRRLLLTGIAPEDDLGGDDFAERFRARYGSDPHPRAVLGYAAMQLVLDAVERAGPDAASRPAVISQALRIAGEPPAGFAAFRISGDGLVRVASEL
jgi:ABC-type branched-subunit amino acid transport system substrate-binding protein